jgi:hypothetical protein
MKENARCGAAFRQQFGVLRKVCPRSDEAEPAEVVSGASSSIWIPDPCQVEALPLLQSGSHGNPASAARVLDATNQIADELDLIRIMIADFDVGESILHQHQYFQAIEPIGAEILTKVRLISDSMNVNVEMLGDKRSDFGSMQALQIRHSLSEAQASEDHGKPP